MAERLTGTLKFLGDGGAIAIDSPWGSGKTWFAKNWKLDLEAQGFTAIYIDAFALDYVDDPFLMIAGELLSVAKALQPELENPLLAAGARLGKAILPIGTKIVTGIAGKWLVGEAVAGDLGETISEAVEGLGGVAEKQVERKLKEYETEKQSAAAYLEKLAQLAATQTNPIVIFVDELDRCRPDFAVKTLERIKHFFEVPGVVFVLLVNGKQLAASVRGAYGAEVDAESYLRKFILFSVRLPKLNAGSYSDYDAVYCKEILRAYGFAETQGHNFFAEQFAALASALHLEYRDLERGIALYVLAQPVNEAGPLIAWVIALKLWKPEVFDRLLRGDSSVHAEIIELAQAARFGDSFVVKHALNLHKAHVSQFQTEIDSDTQQQLLHMAGRRRDLKSIFPWLTEKVNLSLT